MSNNLFDWLFQHLAPSEWSKPTAPNRVWVVTSSATDLWSIHATEESAEKERARMTDELPGEQWWAHEWPVFNA